MTYSLGGLIEASDYNNFAGGNGGGANVSGQLNTVLGTGYGNAGYGQTSVSNVSVAGSVTAAQWSTLVSGVNKVRSHQSAAFSNLSLYTVGTTINATTDVSTNLTNAYTNRLVKSSGGTTVTGSVGSSTMNIPNQTASASITFSRTATFASADQARYFFNAGGELRFFIDSYTNTGGTTRGLALGALALDGFGGKTIYAGNASARYGVGSVTVTTDLTTNSGYYRQTAAQLTMTQLDGSTYGAQYSSDQLLFKVNTNGTQGSNGDAGTTLTAEVTLTTGSQSPAFNDSVNLTVYYRMDIAYPPVNSLTNTWGAVTIS
jgi:hypothetical protein